MRKYNMHDEVYNPNKPTKMLWIIFFHFEKLVLVRSDKNMDRLKWQKLFSNVGPSKECKETAKYCRYEKNQEGIKASNQRQDG